MIRFALDEEVILVFLVGGGELVFPLELVASLSLSDPGAGLREIFIWFFILILIWSSSFLCKQASSSSSFSRGILVWFRSFCSIILSSRARLSYSSFSSCCLCLTGEVISIRSIRGPVVTAAGGEPVDKIPGGR